MNQYGQAGLNRHAHPFWTRVAAVCSLLLIFLASSAQAGHFHQESLRTHCRLPAEVSSSDVEGPADAANCPLCVAMHSALPAGLRIYGSLAYVVEAAPTQLTRTILPRVLDYSLRSRPPPGWSFPG